MNNKFIFEYKHSQWSELMQWILIGKKSGRIRKLQLNKQ